MLKLTDKQEVEFNRLPEPIKDTLVILWKFELNHEFNVRMETLAHTIVDTEMFINDVAKPNNFRKIDLHKLNSRLNFLNEMVEKMFNEISLYVDNNVIDKSVAKEYLQNHYRVLRDRIKGSHEKTN